MPEPVIAATTVTSPVRSELRVVRDVPQQAEEQQTALWVGATPISQTFQSETLRAGVRRLQELARLRPNWDSYGSPPLLASSVEAAARILAAAAVEGAPVPFIGPVAGGGIEFSWVAAPRELEIAVHADGSVVYLATDEGREAEGEIGASLEPSARSLLRWFGATSR